MYSTLPLVNSFYIKKNYLYAVVAPVTTRNRIICLYLY